MTPRRAVGAALSLLLADIAVGGAQQLPSGGGPMPELRRGANGQIETVPTAPAARPAPRRPDVTPTVVPPNSGPTKPAQGGPPAPVRVAAPPTPPAGPVRPVIEIRPKTPRMPDTAPRGTFVANFSVRMSDYSQFTGTVKFGPPYYDDNGRFALDGNRIIVNPEGSGVGPNKATVTNHITLEATPETRAGR